jgi:hypothetical protein
MYKDLFFLNRFTFAGSWVWGLHILLVGRVHHSDFDILLLQLPFPLSTFDSSSPESLPYVSSFLMCHVSPLLQHPECCSERSGAALIILVIQLGGAFRDQKTQIFLVHTLIHQHALASQWSFINGKKKSWLLKYLLPVLRFRENPTVNALWTEKRQRKDHVLAFSS